MSERSRLLGAYLNDHLAGATGARERFRAATGVAEGAFKVELGQLTRQTRDDRRTLLWVMRTLGVRVRHDKAVAVWVKAKASRLKISRHPFSDISLRDVIELEQLLLSVQAKAAALRALRSIADQDRRLDATDLDRLLTRAEQQSRILEQLHLSAVTRAFTGPDPSLIALHIATGT